MTALKFENPCFEKEGIEVVNLDYLKTNEVKELTDRVYSKFTPAKNASNQLDRGVRWGVAVNGEFHWTLQNSYQLPAELNPEESGNIRYMDLIPDEFLNNPAIQRLIMASFFRYFPDGCTKQHAYSVQLSSIRYQPKVCSTCYPSPDMPHQDGYDNAIYVLNKTDNIIGGYSRVFTLDNEMVFEANLDQGQGIYVQDDAWKHQVLPMMMDVSDGNINADCYRDILIVRINPLKR